MSTSRERVRLRRLQREAIWKWRWLGFRNSTPGFKGAVGILVVAAVSVFVRALTL